MTGNQMEMWHPDGTGAYTMASQDGYSGRITKQGTNWVVTVKDDVSGQSRTSELAYASENEAMTAAGRVIEEWKRVKAARAAKKQGA